MGRKRPTRKKTRREKQTDLGKGGGWGDKFSVQKELGNKKPKYFS